MKRVPHAPQCKCGACRHRENGALDFIQRARAVLDLAVTTEDAERFDELLGEALRHIYQGREVLAEEMFWRKSAGVSK